MNTDAAVSVVIPVHNAEKTLARCLDSVAGQTYGKLEIIIVNDGSTDGSLELCEEYSRRDERIILINKENGGVSSARNAGLERASGKYVAFADSDDRMAPTLAEALFTAMEKHDSDIAVCDFYRVKDEYAAVKGDIGRGGPLDKKTFATLLLGNPADFYYGVLWNKLYRLDIIRELNLRFDGDIKWCEDYIFNLRYISRAENIYILKEPLYYYYDNKNSLAKQRATLKNFITIKRRVFGEYKSLYSSLGMYETGAEKLRVASLLLAVAGDGKVDRGDKDTIHIPADIGS